jgi:hypothetical protein
MRTNLKAIRAKGGKLSEDKKKREKQLAGEFKEALEAAAECVGHEPSTLKSQYLVPGLEDSYLKDGTVIDKLGALVYDDAYDAYVDTDTGAVGPNGPTGHYRVLCGNCGSVIRQCRCASPDRVEFYEDFCSQCRKPPLTDCVV